MRYEWDDKKRAVNKAKHGLDFADMTRFDWDFAFCLDAQTVDFEERELWVGPIHTELCAVVTVERTKDTIRVISLRIATNHEKAEWRKEFQNV